MAPIPATPVEWPALCQANEPLLRLALQEDLGAGDVTSEAIFPTPQTVRGHVVSRTPTVVCAVPWAAYILRRLDAQAQLDAVAPEGAWVPPGAQLLRFQADVRAVLAAERTLLNFLMRLCGIATQTRQAVDSLPQNCPAAIYDTRKTVAGWRSLEKAAVRTGGGRNQRMGLYDAVLIKDNHIVAAGGITPAVHKARAKVGKTMAVEVEIDSLTQLSEALAAQPDIILLDNFTDAAVAESVQRCRGYPHIALEASGGITLARLPNLGATGVQRISMGSLTHTVVPADLSLEFIQ